MINDMHQDLITFNQAQRAKKKDIPNLHSGDVVRIHRKIVEGGKERIQVFQGMVIAIKGGQSSSPTATVRKISFGIGVEIVVPLYSDTIEKIEVVKSTRSRRAKLYYVREKSAKLLRRKLKEVGLKVGKGVRPEEEIVAEATPADEDAPTDEDTQEETAPTEETTSGDGSENDEATPVEEANEEQVETPAESETVEKPEEANEEAEKKDKE